MITGQAGVLLITIICPVLLICWKSEYQTSGNSLYVFWLPEPAQ